ncbi:MAG: ABC transporter permease [Candidatus Doudnabacteria bacterium]
MTRSFTQLFKMNMRMIYRNPTGLFFTLVMPVLIYVILSVLPIGKIAGDRVNYSDFVLPGIIALTIMQGGIYGLAYYMIDLKSRNVIKRFLVTPISQAEFIFSLLASRVLIAILQLVFLSVIGWLLFDATIGVNIVFAFGFAVLGSGIFSIFGFLISVFADSYEAAAPITAAVGLPLTFLGNIFYPIEALPGFLQTFAKILPITYLASGIRSVYDQTATWGGWGYDAGILLIWLLVMTVIALKLFKLKE